MSAPAMLRVSADLELSIDMVTEASAIVATRGAGKSSASAVIVEEAVKLGVQVVIFDRTGVYWGLRSNRKGDGPGLSVYVLGGPHGDVPLEQNAGALIADLVVDSGHGFVLDLSDFSKSGAIRFAADYLERLYDRKARARSTLLLVMDEAHFYAPQTPRGGFKGDSARLMGAMEDVAGLGRSRGIGVVLTTQRTQALNKAILDLIETLVVMRMLSPRARNAVREWIQEKHEDDREGVLATLDSLPTGTAWVWSPLRGILQRTALRRIKTFDSYDTPKPGQARVEPSARQELDLDALGEQMRATVERAKADDPRELRKRIAELERELDKKSNEPGPASEPIEVIREVPVVPSEVLEGLDAGERRVHEAAAAFEEAARALRAVVAALPEPAPRSLPPAATRAPAGRASHAAGTPSPSRQVQDRSPGPAASNGNEGGGDASQRVLDALAWWQAARVGTVSRLQLAMVAGYHPRTNAFTGALAELKDAGHIDFPRAGYVQMLASGQIKATHPVERPESSEGLQRMILARFSGPRLGVLLALLDADELPVSRTELAERLQYHPHTNAYTGALGSLKALGLITFPRAGWVAPSEAMYLR